MNSRLLIVPMCCLALGLAACGGGVRGVASMDPDDGEPGGGGGASQAELDAANAALKTARENATRLTAQLATATGQVTTLTRARDAAMASVTRLTGELKTAADRVTELTAQLATATGNVTTLTQARDAARADVTRLTGELATANGNVATLTQARDAARADVTRLTGELATANENIEELTGERDMARTERDADRTQISAGKVTFGENIGAPLTETIDGSQVTATTPPTGNPAGSDVVRTWRVDTNAINGNFRDNHDARVGGANRDHNHWDRSAANNYDPGTFPSVGYVAPDPDNDVDGSPSILGDPAMLAVARQIPTPDENDDESAMEWQNVFPGRGTVFRGGVRASQAIHTDGTVRLASASGGYAADQSLIIQGERTDAATPAVIRSTDDTGAFRKWDGKWQASFRYYDDERGFTMTFSGLKAPAPGTAPDETDGESSALVFGDLMALPPKTNGGFNQAGSAGFVALENHFARDIEISFGDPSPDPWGQRGYWWRMEVESALLDIERWKDGEEGRPAGTDVGDPKLHYVADTDGDSTADEEAPDGYHEWRVGGTHTIEDNTGTDRDGFPYIRLSDSPPEGELGGAYEAFLSNYAGALDGTDGLPGTADDVHLYLQYAAYGLFSWIDANSKPDPQHRGNSDRYQTFHYGFDAFDAEAGTPTPALPATSMEAVFAGKTSGWILMPESPDTTRGVNAGTECFGTTPGAIGSTTTLAACQPNYINAALRMRGDIKLRACIGGSSGTCEFSSGTADDVDYNEIKGRIFNMEYSPGPGQGWTDRSTSAFRAVVNPIAGNAATTPGPESMIHGTVDLAGDIEAGGTYSGTANPRATPEARTDAIADADTATMATYWSAGKMEGAFYGPQDALETAGTWYIPRAAATASPVGIVGSFGAACTSADCSGD